MIYHKHKNRTHKNHTQGTQEIEKQKWATFTYSGPEIRTITNLFRHTNLKIAYETTNIIKHHLKSKCETLDIYSRVEYTNYNAENVHSNISDKRDEHLEPVTKNTYTPSKPTNNTLNSHNTS
jgi:hypothetical protein